MRQRIYYHLQPHGRQGSRGKCAQEGRANLGLVLSNKRIKVCLERWKGVKSTTMSTINHQPLYSWSTTIVSAPRYESSRDTKGPCANAEQISPIQRIKNIKPGWWAMDRWFSSSFLMLIWKLPDFTWKRTHIQLRVATCCPNQLANKWDQCCSCTNCKSHLNHEKHWRYYSRDL